MAERSGSADVDALDRRLRSLDRNVAGYLQENAGKGWLALAAQEPIRFYERSPFPDDPRFFGAIDLNIDRYDVDDATKCCLVLAIGMTGVVGHTKHGCLYLRDSRPAVLREASSAEASVLPTLCRDWESYLEERDVFDHDREHAALLALLAPYDLRDGNAPAEPFTMRRGYVGRGWYGIMKELVEDLIKLGWNREVLQIKEKFGTLRFYTTHHEDALRDRLIAAREHSAEVCEVCGRGGSLRTSPLHAFMTRCDPCWATEQRRLERR